MVFQVWIRDLLCDAVSRNMAHVVARMSPTDLRSLYEEDVNPAIDAILAHYEGRRRPKPARSVVLDNDKASRQTWHKIA